ncbi:MAG TPA: ABC transporter permease, partial [Bryobacteraceae bacterium]|nr:ABC transporter permease [Bryobacteraceae bacterium]
MIRSLLRNLLQRELVEHELDDDLRAYQRMLIEEKCASGLSEEDAVREMALEIGSLQAVKENVREARMGWTLETIWRDVRYSGRALRKAPGFTAASIVILSLGIGANTAVFSIFSAALLRPLPYAGEDRIVAISEKRLREDSARSPVSVADFLDWRNLTKNLESIALYDSTRQTITSGDQVELAPSARVTAGFFEALGVQPLFGRTFGVADENPGGRRVAILSYSAWRLRFGGDRDILGRSVTVGGEPAEVVGVLQEGFRYPFAASCEFFEPLRFTAAQRRYRGIHPYDAIGRLKERATFEQARAEMEVISKQLESQYPETNAGHVANLVPLRQELTGKMQSTLAILMGAGLLLILIACANVASLLLARASARKRETALRLALGCDRMRLLTQSLVESSILSIAGAAGGIALAVWGVAILRSLYFERLASFAVTGLDRIELDWRVLAFTLASVILSTALFGSSSAASAWRLALDQSLRSGGRGSGSGDSQRFRSALVIAQVALAVLLLVGAGLLSKSFLELMNVKLGFQAEHRTTAILTLPALQYRTLQQAAKLYDSVIDRMASMPGVQSAAVTDILPLSGNDNRAGAQVEGYDPRPDEHIRMNPRLVTPGYLETMGIPVRVGRMFSASDAAIETHLAVVSEITANRYWPNESAVGKRFRFTVEGAPWLEVVGVVGSVHNRAPDREPTPDVYLPFRENQLRYVPTRVALVIKSSLDASLGPGIRQAIASIDRSVSVADIRPLDSFVDDVTVARRFILLLVSLFATAALVLAAIGLYGLLSFVVGQRTAEIGVRMALGASRFQILREVLAQG